MMGCLCNNKLAFAAGAGLAVAGGLLAAIYACQIIPPYLYDQSFQPTTCTVETSFQNGNFCCDAVYSGMGSCLSIVPCFQVKVNYPAAIGGNVSSTLFRSYKDTAYQNPNNNCSYYSCPKDYSLVLTEATAFVAQYGMPGQVHSCFWNTANPGEVLLSKTDLGAVISSILLPLIGLIVGCVIAHLGYRGKLPCCQTDWDDDDDDSSDTESGQLVTKMEDNTNGSKQAIAEVDKSKEALENGDLTQTEENATEDTNVEVLSLESQPKLKDSKDSAELA